ncbi:MAG: bacterial proteasome activator family protein [Acidimicrobiia bacterium]|nr:bacterial proteasome activator family protein [Acidimicrobiia bacterium]MDH3463790.1 bacterial proteasome activator family protein [Acidimicrobiia bacterium]
MDESTEATVIEEPKPAPEKAEVEEEQPVSQPTKLIRIATMTRAMLEEVRQAPLDEGGRSRLAEVHGRSIAELRDVLSPELLDEFDEIMIPLKVEAVTEAELRIAQAQLIGWLEGLFHGIQASLWSQQMAAQSQLAEMQRRALTAPQADDSDRSGLYL